MTLKPIPKWMENLIGLAFVPVVAPLFVWIWINEWHARRFYPPQGEWQRKFAWWPTRLDFWGGPVVWLEWVERSRYGHGILYRRPGDVRIKGEWEPDEE